MITGRQIGNAEDVLGAQLLPMAVIIFYKPVGKTLAAAREKINAANSYRYFIVPPGSCNIFTGKE